MVFSSILFLEYFLPIVLLLYYLVLLLPIKNKITKRRFSNAVLLTASLVFYVSGGFSYLLILAGVLALNYLGGALISNLKNKRKMLLWITVLADFGILFFFKYLNLFVTIYENLITKDLMPSEMVSNIITLTRTGKLSFVDIVLPIGISFYIFQAVSYVIDIYRGDAKPQKNFFDFALYISFFPQLIAGPIVKYTDIEKQLFERTESAGLFYEGVTKFIYGLAKKVLIANTLAQVIDSIMELEIKGLGAGVTWLGAINYTLQIYYDFSGYSDMAIGLGKMFGFNFMDNFNYPYIAKSVQDFWRRWHISLSSWFKQYVYIPLGGSRVETGKIVRNIFIVFLFTGIWHGANFTFVVWGLVYAVLLVAERLFLGKLLNKSKVISRIYTLFFVILLWVVFRCDNILQAGVYIREMFTKGTGEYTVLSFLSVKSIAALLAGLLFSMPIYKKIGDRVKRSIPAVIFRTVLLAASMLVVLNGSYNPFLYFQF